MTLIFFNANENNMQLDISAISHEIAPPLMPKKNPNTKAHEMPTTELVKVMRKNFLFIFNSYRLGIYTQLVIPGQATT